MSLRTTHFAKINGEVDIFSGGKQETFLRCYEHGVVPPIPFYSIYQNGYTARDPIWTCLRCFEKWTGFAVQAALEKNCCHCCKSVENIKACEMCGKLVCFNHQQEGVCDDCFEGIRGAGGK
jgi:hypothetical protein